MFNMMPILKSNKSNPLRFHKSNNELEKRLREMDMETIEAVARIVCDITGRDILDITGHSRKREFVEVRYIIIYLSILTGRLSSKTGGLCRFFNKKDHTAILRGFNQAQSFIDIEDSKFMPLLQSCWEALNNKLNPNT